MLQNLLIENYALIEKLDISFSNGFSVITGETGAGKSIMLGALSLILGARADTKVLKNENRKCIIEGNFKIANYGLHSLFDENDLDYDDYSILRREIAPSGKSRAFINDTPVTLSVLKELGDRLVNIHSQHETITLNDANFQLAVIDNFAANDDKLLQYENYFADYKKLVAELENLKTIDSQAKSDLDYLQFQFDELEKANLQKGELSELEEELKVLSHAEEIKTALHEAIDKLENSEINVLDYLSDIDRSITRISNFHPDIEEVSDRISSSLIDLKDIGRELNVISDTITMDPARLAEVNERLNLIYALQQKHKVQTVEELILIQEKLDTQLNAIENIDDQIEVLNKSVKEKEHLLQELASNLSDSRRNVIPDIEQSITSQLFDVGMKDARFNILIEPLAELSKDGIDRIKFLFNANKGGALNEISKIASGGELSRLMLAIKSLISGKKLLPTIIFDEIDMGVSGEVAAKVGNILSKMSVDMQVVSITHLPQIAGKGDTHFRVYKTNVGDNTQSVIERLNDNDRIFEIAKMMSGATVTDAAMENARIMLSN